MLKKWPHANIWNTLTYLSNSNWNWNSISKCQRNSHTRQLRRNWMSSRMCFRSTMLSGSWFSATRCDWWDSMPRASRKLPRPFVMNAWYLRPRIPVGVLLLGFESAVGVLLLGFSCSSVCLMYIRVCLCYMYVPTYVNEIQNFQHTQNINKGGFRFKLCTLKFKFQV